MNIHLEEADVVVEPQGGPSVDAQLVGEAFGRIRIVAGREVTERAGNIQIAQRPEALRDVEIGLIAAAEIVPDSDTKQWDVLVIRLVNEQRMSGHGLVSTELFMIEPCGGHDVKIR